ncbi:hypothetical protein Aab01nite_08240 [Paractinoplanes abujensis]|nr:hypothetical protein Aab01nite_08240 [Actinoplanes abujensis]
MLSHGGAADPGGELGHETRPFGYGVGAHRHAALGQPYLKRTPTQDRFRRAGVNSAPAIRAATTPKITVPPWPTLLGGHRPLPIIVPLADLGTAPVDNAGLWTTAQ